MVKNFKMIDEKFICDNCKKEINPLNYSARDHCPYCLVSKHVDVNPGDRLSKCQGLMFPVSIDKYRDTYKIVYKCQKCGYIHRNIMARDDDLDMLLKIISEEN